MFVYILKCSDDSYYTGVTGNREKRINQHKIGEFKSCYTFMRRSLDCVFLKEIIDPNEVIRVEKQIKGWSRAKKEALINGDYNELVRLSNLKNNIKQNT